MLNLYETVILGGDESFSSAIAQGATWKDVNSPPRVGKKTERVCPRFNLLVQTADLVGVDRKALKACAKFCGVFEKGERDILARTIHGGEYSATPSCACTRIVWALSSAINIAESAQKKPRLEIHATGDSWTVAVPTGLSIDETAAMMSEASSWICGDKIALYWFKKLATSGVTATLEQVRAIRDDLLANTGCFVINAEPVKVVRHCPLMPSYKHEGSMLRDALEPAFDGGDISDSLAYHGIFGMHPETK